MPLAEPELTLRVPGFPGQQTSSRTMDSLSFPLQAAFQKAAIAALTRRLQSSIAAANADAAAEMDSLFETQGKLTR